MMMMMINTPMIKENATRNCQKFTCGGVLGEAGWNMNVSKNNS